MSVDDVLARILTQHRVGDIDDEDAKTELYQMMLGVIGKDVTQQERHWHSEVWGDVCGRNNTTRHERCICEQLNGLKAEQRTALKQAFGMEGERE